MNFKIARRDQPRPCLCWWPKSRPRAVKGRSRGRRLSGIKVLLVSFPRTPSPFPVPLLQESSFPFSTSSTPTNPWAACHLPSLPVKIIWKRVVTDTFLGI